jgi:hypothetical protein
MTAIKFRVELTFRHTIAAQQARRFGDAANAYRAVIGAQPLHFDALNFLVGRRRSAYLPWSSKNLEWVPRGSRSNVAALCGA